MVTDEQVKALRQLKKDGRTLKLSTLKAGMDVKTGRKYLKACQYPSQMRPERVWKTRTDPFSEVWPEVKAKIEVSVGLEAKTLFEDLQQHHPGRFAEGQLRTLQRRIKVWKALHGPGKEVMFPQKHQASMRCESDFTSMNRLEITIARQAFNHLLYHFVLPYSNWETGMVCYSESYESLSEGLQNALWELGGVPQRHKSDRFSAAVNNLTERRDFTRRYEALLNYYGLEGEKIQAGCPNENGDVEQRHYRLKRAVEQALLLRGSRDFETLEAYQSFLRGVIGRQNEGRSQKYEEELKNLRTLPARRLEDSRELKARVSAASTIRVQNNVYSVHSRLIEEWVTVKLFADTVEVWYGQQKIDRMPRQRGRGKHSISYRHIIDWLVRKPGAFAQYRYQSDLFPNSYFRIVYDVLREKKGGRADSEYLKILSLAAWESEAGVTQALQALLAKNREVDSKSVKAFLAAEQPICVQDPHIRNLNLCVYDDLLATKAVGL